MNRVGKKGVITIKKYLLLVEDEKLWERFKGVIQKDINSELMEMIKKKVDAEVKKNGK